MEKTEKNVKSQCKKLLKSISMNVNREHPPTKIFPILIRLRTKSSHTSHHKNKYKNKLKK